LLTQIALPLYLQVRPSMQSPGGELSCRTSATGPGGTGHSWSR